VTYTPILDRGSSQYLSRLAIRENDIQPTSPNKRLTSSWSKDRNKAQASTQHCYGVAETNFASQLMPGSALQQKLFQHM
jgi:hypothetical protein